MLVRRLFNNHPIRLLQLSVSSGKGLLCELCCDPSVTLDTVRDGFCNCTWRWRCPCSTQGRAGLAPPICSRRRPTRDTVDSVEFWGRPHQDSSKPSVRLVILYDHPLPVAAVF